MVAGVHPRVQHRASPGVTGCRAVGDSLHSSPGFPPRVPCLFVPSSTALGPTNAALVQGWAWRTPMPTVCLLFKHDRGYTKLFDWTGIWLTVFSVSGSVPRFSEPCTRGTEYLYCVNTHMKNFQNFQNKLWEYNKYKLCQDNLAHFSHFFASAALSMCTRGTEYLHYINTSMTKLSKI